MSVLQITKSTNALNIWFDDIKMYLVLDDGRELFQMNTVMAFFKALKIKFEVAKDTPYDTGFVAKIERGREDYRNGKGITISMDELNDLCK